MTTAIIILLCVAGLCISLAFFFLAMTIKYKDEDFAFMFAVGLIACLIIAATSIEDAVKRANKEHEQRRELRLDEKSSEP